MWVLITNIDVHDNVLHSSQSDKNMILLNILTFSSYLMCWMSKPDLEIQHLTSKTVFQTEDFLENILIESHKVWWDNKSIKGILVRLLVDYHDGVAW